MSREAFQRQNGAVEVGNSDDFYEKIRQINQQNAASDPATLQDTSQMPEAPAGPRKFRERLAEYAPGLILIAWTVLPLSLALLFVEELWGLLCFYPLLSPLAWIAIAGARPDKAGTTVVMGIAGHVILAVSLWYIVSITGGMGDYYIGYGVVGLLVLLALLLYSALGSVLTVLLAAHFFSAKSRA